MSGHAIGRRRRVLRRANERAQRRFHAAIDAGVIFDETALATRRYVEAERLIDAILAPEVHPTPVAVLLSSLGFPVVEILSRDDEGFEAIVNVWSEAESRMAWGDR